MRLRSSLAVAAAVFLAARLASELAPPSPGVVPFWPAAGVGFVSLLIGGARRWPSVLAGHLAHHGWQLAGAPLVAGSVHPIVVALPIALGATAQAALGADLVRRRLPRDARRSSWFELARATTVVAPVACLLGATGRAATAAFAPEAGGSAIGSAFAVGWMAELVGVLAVVPFQRLLVARRSPSQRRLFALGLAVAGLVAGSALAWTQARGSDRQRIRDEIDREVSAVATALDRELERCEDALLAVRSFGPRARDPERAELERFLADILRSHPATRAIAWAPAVAPEGAARFPVECSAAAGTDDRWHGTDLAADPGLEGAIGAARRSGRLIATPIHPAAGGGPSCIDLVLPVFEGLDAERAGSTSRARLVGVAVAEVSVAELLARASGIDPDHAFGLSLIHRPGRPQAADVATWERGVHFGARSYRFAARPTRAHAERHASAQPLFVLVAGLTLCALVGAFLAKLSGHAARIEHEVALRTRKLLQMVGELRSSERRTQAILDTAADAILLADEGARVQSCNAAARALFGEGDGGVEGRALGELLPALAGGGLDRYVGAGRELEGRRNGGERFTASLSLSRVDLPDQTVYTLIVRDLTQEIALQAQLARAQKLESIGRLAAGVAHEINTPTQFVTDNTRFLRDAVHDLVRLEATQARLRASARGGVLDPALVAEVDREVAEIDLDFLFEEMPAALDAALEGLERVATIVQSMKEFAHPGQEHKSPIDLNHAIESTLTVSRNEWKYVADVELDLDPKLPAVPCFAGELNQVVLNLVVNGAHAIADARTDGERGTLSIRTRREGEEVAIEVSDTGTGIPEEARPHVFDPFFTTKDVGRGSGQGLALAHAVVVERHGGRLDFETETGVGTTFTIRLPLHDEPLGPAS